MKKAYLFAAAAILCWSTMATVSKLMLGSFSQYQLLCVSALIAGTTLAVFNLFTGKLKKLKEYKPKDYLRMILIGLCGDFIYYMCYYGGASLMPASIAFVVNYSWPVMSVVFACLVLKEKLTPRKTVALAISFAGVILISGSTISTLDTNLLAGTLLCLLGATAYGAFTAFQKKYAYDSAILMMIAFYTSFVLTWIVNLLMGAEWSADAAQMLGFAWNGIFVMAVGNVCWMLALKYGSTAKISNLAYITPFLSLVLVFVFLHEPIAPVTLIGLVVIVLGILLQIKDKK